MKSKVKAMENFTAGWEIWLVNSMCLVASYLWWRLCGLLCYRRRHRTLTPADIQVKDISFNTAVYTAIITLGLLVFFAQPLLQMQNDLFLCWMIIWIKRL